MIYKTKKFVDRCLKTKGVVVDLSWFSQQVDAEGSPIYPHDFGKTPSGEEKYASPVVQFVDPRSGRKITVGSSWGVALLLIILGRKLPSFMTLRIQVMQK